MGLIPEYEDPLKESTATHSSVPAWTIPWTEEPGRLWSIGCKESDTTEATQHTRGTKIPHAEWYGQKQINKFKKLMPDFASE